MANDYSSVSSRETNSLNPRKTRRELFKIGGMIAAASSAVSVFGVAAAARAMPGGLGQKEDRLRESYDIRVDAAKLELEQGAVPHPANGDEAQFPNGIANFTKGLAHDQLGETSARTYQNYLAALGAGSQAALDALVLGGKVPLTNPLAGLAFDLEGADSHQLAIPAAPSFSSAQRGAETVEVYWQAVLRDLPFSQYSTDPSAQAAAAELSALAAFTGPRDSHGNVTGATLFRGFTAGDLIGPYVSQLLLKPFSYGAVVIGAGYKTELPLSQGGSDYLITLADWLSCQNGTVPAAVVHPDPTPRFPRLGRDLGVYVHTDTPYEAYFNAAQMLAALGAPLNPANPYAKSKSEAGFATFGTPHLLALLGEVSSRALKAVWYEKWYVHRVIRPEEFGGRIHLNLTGQTNYPIDPSILGSKAVQEVFTRNNTYLLPLQYREGCPQHPSYAQGHGVIAGACVTVLKWFFDESFVIPEPVVPSDDGTELLPYGGLDAAQMTLGNEADKLAGNIGIGRNFAGVHYRSDYQEGLLLGEALAISVLRDQAATYAENYQGFTFTRF
ncbi:MAG: vanadium-dependent haloperoxidase, partial [Deltaproteobacteria bacterium]|nr:vanadium-dependent haloperoxidase [Deltaproteobacteria bacterium]